jgi:predicted transcriptional regulator
MSPNLTPRELDVIAAVWQLESATVAEVMDELDTELAYTTVLTVLRGLELKGYVRHEQEGRAHRFYPVVDAEEAGEGLLQRLLDRVYQGSPVQLVAHLVADRDLSAAEIAEMRKLLDAGVSAPRARRKKGKRS